MKKKTLLSAMSLLLLAANAFAQTETNKRPNIVFLMTDDQRWDMLGCYGRTDVITPHIDKLAEQGVTFDKAYYAVAICMPSRTTMFTGRYFSDHRVGFTYPYNRTLPAAEFADSYPAKMKEAGYRTGFVGKFGIRLEAMEPTTKKHFDFFVQGGKIWPREDGELVKIVKRRPPEERTLIKGDAMIRFLETQPADQPFCLSISFDAVKNDRDSQMYTPHVELFKDKKMWVPENYVEGKNEALPKVLDYWRGTGLHQALSSTPELQQNVTRRFAVQGYTVDQQVGRLMAKLEEMGVLENTIVIYTSDNGRFQGSHGLFGKSILYEEAIKAPFIVFDGRVPQEQRGRRENTLVSSVDFAPTMLSMAGLEVPESMRGKNLKGVLNGTEDKSQWRSAVLIESLFLQEIHTATEKEHPDIPGLNEKIIAGNRSYRSRGVTTDRYKYFKYFEHDPAIEELYDLENDPHEMNNLISNPEYAEVLSKLRKQTEELHAEATTH
ncbi:MAG: sulfatase-like hydrolase/transferase [Akkermansiaceae bacterium]|jgi:arylsulfatase A-like enzyme|nr:sulfatase-like hydrolase/transferase [Akkermansiaceae bacterium]MDP4994903.1 sulfatase-like hydrolase/transferase [Akkermansiaceae bacterium]